MGERVDIYSARMSGQFDLTFSDGERIQYGDEIVLVQRVKVGEYSIKELANGDTKRVNVFKPLEARVLTNDSLKQALLHELGMSSPEQGSLFELDEPYPAPRLLSAPEPAPEVTTLSEETTNAGLRRLKEAELGLPLGALTGTQQELGALNVWVEEDGTVGRYDLEDFEQFWLGTGWFPRDVYLEEISTPVEQDLVPADPEDSDDEPAPRSRRAARPVGQTSDRALSQFLEG